MNFRLEEVASQCGVEPDLIFQFVELTWIKPADWDHHVLDEEDMARIRLICDLKNNFGVGDEAIPLILHLVDQLNRIHLEIRRR